MSNYFISTGAGTSGNGLLIGGTSPASPTGDSKFTCNLPANLGYMVAPSNTILLNGTPINYTYLIASGAQGNITQPIYSITSSKSTAAGTTYAAATAANAVKANSCPISGVTGMATTVSGAPGQYIIARGIDTNLSMSNCVQYWRVWNTGWKEVFSVLTIASLPIASSWGSCYETVSTSRPYVTFPTTDNNPDWPGFTATPTTCHGWVWHAGSGGYTIFTWAFSGLSTTRSSTFGTLRGTSAGTLSNCKLSVYTAGI